MQAQVIQHGNQREWQTLTAVWGSSFQFCLEWYSQKQLERVLRICGRDQIILSIPADCEPANVPSLYARFQIKDCTSAPDAAARIRKSVDMQGVALNETTGQLCICLTPEDWHCIANRAQALTFGIQICTDAHETLTAVQGTFYVLPAVIQEACSAAIRVEESALTATPSPGLKFV